MKQLVFERDSLTDGNFKLYSNDIRKAVNAFDKEFGIDLKDPDNMSNPETFRNVIVEKARMNLAADIVLVNGNVITDYFDFNMNGFPLKTISTEDPLFINDSLLHWDKRNSRYKTDSLIFRARFISCVLELIMKNFDKIIFNSTKYSKHSEAEIQIINTKKFMDYIVLFINIMIDRYTPYQNIILKMHEITSYKYKKVNQMKLKDELGTRICYTRKNLHSNMIVDRFYSDDMGISEILKISYMLATNDYNTSKLPKFKYIEGATLQHDLIKLIEALGNCIIDHNGNKNYPIMFLSFIKAKASIPSQYTIEKFNEPIKIGIAAIGYCKFVMNDDNVDDFIDEMLKKGI